jgi:hypothetical protein
LSKIITISGKAQHGKTTSAEIIKTILTDKNKTAIIFNYGDILKFICKDYFGWNGKKDEHGRRLLQYVGTDFIRIYDRDFFVNIGIYILKVVFRSYDYVIVADCRFPNEINGLKEKFNDVITLKVFREDYESNLTEEQQQHPSETSLDTYLFDYIIIAENIHELIEKLIDFCEKI